jgi:hypothetical protein
MSVNYEIIIQENNELKEIIMKFGFMMKKVVLLKNTFNDGTIIHL